MSHLGPTRLEDWRWHAAVLDESIAVAMASAAYRGWMAVASRLLWSQQVGVRAMEVAS